MKRALVVFILALTMVFVICYATGCKKDDGDILSDLTTSSKTSSAAGASSVTSPEASPGTSPDTSPAISPDTSAGTSPTA